MASQKDRKTCAQVLDTHFNVYSLTRHFNSVSAISVVAHKAAHWYNQMPKSEEQPLKSYIALLKQVEELQRSRAETAATARLTRETSAKPQTLRGIIVYGRPKNGAYKTGPERPTLKTPKGYFDLFDVNGNNSELTEYLRQLFNKPVIVTCHVWGGAQLSAYVTGTSDIRRTPAARKPSRKA